MLVYPYRALVLAAAAEEVAQRKVQFGGVRVALYRLNKGVNGLVLLLVQQEIESLEIGLGGLAVFNPQLAQVKPRCQPAEYKNNGQGQQ